MSARPILAPTSRLVILIAIGLAALCFMSLLALQPGTGWQWHPAGWRAVTEVGPPLWVSLFTGFTAYAVSAWVWALRPRNPAAILFAASGLMTLVFCFTAIGHLVTYPIPYQVQVGLRVANMLSASAFGIIMICLFLLYPTRAKFWRPAALLVALVFGLWTLVRTFGPFMNLMDVQRITFLEMVVMLAAIAWQIRASRDDPRHRAIAAWLGTTTLLGAGSFIVAVALPQTFGRPAFIEVNYAFAFFLFIYAGLAAGLLRYRLFDLGSWAYRLAFYASAALFLVLLDIALISLFALSPGESLGLSLLLIAFAYLPMRDLVWRWMSRRERRGDDRLFLRVLETALQPALAERLASWEGLIRDHFQPLEVSALSGEPGDAQIGEEGLSLSIPATHDLPGLVLHYRSNGRALFTPADAATAEQLAHLMRYAEKSRDAYDRGASEERIRIARDIHDNIGAQLMSALHSHDPVRKDAMIRDTLVDLRDVINNAHRAGLPLDDVLADLRAEISDRLIPHAITLDWVMEVDAGDVLSPATIHALRSCIRETANNTIRHSGATKLTVRIRISSTAVAIEVSDNGRGIGEANGGHGLGNMRSRAEGLGGDFSIGSGPEGTTVSVTMPRRAEGAL